MRAEAQPRVVAVGALGAEPAALEQRADDVPPVADDVNHLRARVGGQRGVDEEGRLGRLLDRAPSAGEAEPSHALDDRAQPPGGLVRGHADELRDRGLERQHLAQVDEPGLAADRLGDERRARPRRADDEDEPVVDAAAASVPAREDASRGAAVERGGPRQPAHARTLAVDTS